MDIINSIKVRDKMYKRLRLTNSDSSTLEKNLKNYNCIPQRNIDAAKTFTMRQNLRNMYEILKTWNIINELLNKIHNETISHHIL